MIFCNLKLYKKTKKKVLVYKTNEIYVKMI